eukprot:3955979-Prorocentrum_lima.AAC.1
MHLTGLASLLHFWQPPKALGQDATKVCVCCLALMKGAVRATQRAVQDQGAKAQALRLDPQT